MLLQASCLQSDGVDLAERRSRALSVDEPRCTALSSGDTAVLCCCTGSLPEALAQIVGLVGRPGRLAPTGWRRPKWAWNMSIPSSLRRFPITLLRDGFQGTRPAGVISSRVHTSCEGDRRGERQRYSARSFRDDEATRFNFVVTISGFPCRIAGSCSNPIRYACAAHQE
jgi:hypothetical protein